MDTETPGPAWHTITQAVLKRHNVNLVPYVPDNVLRPLLRPLLTDEEYKRPTKEWSAFPDPLPPWDLNEGE